MITSLPLGRLSTQNSLSTSMLSVSRFLMLRTASGSHSLTPRLKMFKIVSKLMWRLHSLLLAAPFWRSRTTISNNRTESFHLDVSRCSLFIISSPSSMEVCRISSFPKFYMTMHSDGSPNACAVQLNGRITKMVDSHQKVSPL